MNLLSLFKPLRMVVGIDGEPGLLPRINEVPFYPFTHWRVVHGGLLNINF